MARNPISCRPVVPRRRHPHFGTELSGPASHARTKPSLGQSGTAARRPLQPVVGPARSDWVSAQRLDLRRTKPVQTNQMGARSTPAAAAMATRASMRRTVPAATSQ